MFWRKTRAERTKQRYERWLKAYVPTGTKQIIELTHVITDRKNNNFYTYRTIANMPKQRAIAIEKSILDIEYGVSKDLIVERLEEIKGSFEKFHFKQPTPAALTDFQKKSIDLIGDLVYRMNRIKPDDLMLQAALHFLLIDGENPYIIDADANQRKWDICMSDPEMRAFFLDTMEVILQNWHNTKG